MLQQELLATSRQVFPGGSSGLWRLPDEYQIVVNHGLGSHVWDMTGREYIDCILGSGPVIVGHAHPAVVAAVQAQVAQGATYFLLNEPAIRLAEMVVDAVPCAEQIRFVSTGTEATFYAIRIARAYTGRNKVLKFEGSAPRRQRLRHYEHDTAAHQRLPPRHSGQQRHSAAGAGAGAGLRIQQSRAHPRVGAPSRRRPSGDHHGAAATRAQSGSGFPGRGARPGPRGRGAANLR